MYNTQEVLNAMELIKKYPVTVTKKACHKSVVWQLKRFIVDNHISDINKYLLTPEYNQYWVNYKNAVDQYLTKKELDYKLRLVIKHYYQELNEILKLA